jgi:hypothetical protein
MVGMTSKGYISWGSAIGLGIGICLGWGLLFLGQDRFGTEALEGAAMDGFVVSLPLSAMLDFCFHWGGRADQWTMFLAIVPAANGALLGAAIGVAVLVIRRFLRYG